MPNEIIRRIATIPWEKGTERGKRITLPKPTLIIDSMEQKPYSFKPFQKWFAVIGRKKLTSGDYSIAGLEERVGAPERLLCGRVNGSVSSGGVKPFCGVKGTLFLFIQGLLTDQGKFPQMGKGCRLCRRLLKITEPGGDMLLKSH